MVVEHLPRPLPLYSSLLLPLRPVLSILHAVLYIILVGLVGLGNANREASRTTISGS